MQYAVTVQYERPGLMDSESTLTGSLPTFYLDSNVQGIISEGHAASIIRTSLLRLMPTATFHVDAIAL